MQKYNPLTGKVETFAEDGKIGPVGPQGPIGPQGPQGERGLPGKDGLNGKDGKDGKDGRDGLDGKTGPAGKDGRDGKDGADGENGNTSVIHAVDRMPKDSFGNDGDWAITLFSELFYKEKGKWVFRQSIRGQDVKKLKPAQEILIDTDNNTLVGGNLQDFLNRYYGSAESSAPVFAADGTMTSVTYYSSSTQTTANRIMKTDLTYNTDLNPTTEVTKIYKTTDGTTILKTVTLTYTWTSGVLTKIETVTT